MLAANWSYIRDLLTEWKAQIFRQDQPLQDEIKILLEHFTALLQFVEEQGGHGLGLTSRELAVAVAILALGPQTDADPPAEVCQEILQIVENEVPGATPERCLEVVVAWGCGWGREFQPCTGDWNGELEMAILALASMVEDSIGPAVRWLKGEVANFPAVAPVEIRSYAGLIAWQVAHDLCDCGKPRCDREHWLSHWQPGGKQSLRGFIAQAVRGSAVSGLRSGQFAHGALHPHLAKDTGLVVDKAEFNVCHNHPENDIRIREATQKGKHLRITDARLPPYEGDSCPKCGAGAHLEKTYHLVRKNWFLIRSDYSGAYEEVERWHCSFCGNYYRVELTTCPLCCHKRPQRRTKVWVYHPWLRYQRYSEEADDE